MSDIETRTALGEKYKDAKLMDDSPSNVRVPIGGNMWGVNGMSIETYLAIACQKALREAYNLKYVAMIKASEIDKDSASQFVAGSNPKNWRSISKSINRMAKMDEKHLRIIEYMRMRDSSGKYSSWIKLHTDPEIFGRFALLPVEYVPQILEVCRRPIDMVVYVTMLALTQDNTFNDGVHMTPKKLSETWIPYNDQEICESLTHLILQGLLRPYDVYLLKKRVGTNLVTPTHYRNVEAVPLDEWKESIREKKLAIKNDISNSEVLPDGDVDNIVKLIPKNARVVSSEN